MADRTGSIYVLCTPQGTPFYVGSTVQSPLTRVGQHLRDARTGRGRSPVHEVIGDAGRCGWWILERGVAAECLGERERHHETELRLAGFAMANYYSAGNGCCTQPPHVREAIARYARKRPRDEKGHFLPALPAIAGGSPELDRESWDELKVTNTD